MKIQDGTGTGREVAVDSSNRLETHSVVRSEQLDQSEKGLSFQIGSGNVNLTSASASAVLYVKNNEDKDLVITGVNVTSTEQTGATSDTFLVTIYRGSTALVGGASTAALNNNFGSATSLTADVTAGAEAATLTGGTASGTFYIKDAEFFHTELAWTMPKGTSLGMLITPATSNTSVNVTVTVEAHLAED